MILKIGKKDRKIIREMKQEEDHAFYYLDGNACSMKCQDDWFRHYGQRALDHFGIHN